MSISPLTILVQRALPMVFDESLSYLELLGAVVAKVNEMVAAQNTYFNEDLMSVVRSVLNEWKTDGTLEQQKLHNVLEYGAKGDGLTDDTAAITAACTAAGIVSGVVFFPTGTYLCGSLTIPPAVKKFTGTGKGTILKPTGVFGLNVPFLYFYNSADIEICSFTVDVDHTAYFPTADLVVMVPDPAVTTGV